MVNEYIGPLVNKYAVILVNEYIGPLVNRYAVILVNKYTELLVNTKTTNTKCTSLLYFG